MKFHQISDDGFVAEQGVQVRHHVFENGIVGGRHIDPVFRVRLAVFRIRLDIGDDACHLVVSRFVFDRARYMCKRPVVEKAAIYHAGLRDRKFHQLVLAEMDFGKFFFRSDPGIRMYFEACIGNVAVGRGCERYWKPRCGPRAVCQVAIGHVPFFRIPRAYTKRYDVGVCPFIEIGGMIPFADGEVPRPAVEIGSGQKKVKRTSCGKQRTSDNVL
ncbi:MAG: hypothetical protein ACPGRZ_03640 [Alphaproteobacteria bacterium]